MAFRGLYLVQNHHQKISIMHMQNCKGEFDNHCGHTFCSDNAAVLVWILLN